MSILISKIKRVRKNIRIFVRRVCKPSSNGCSFFTKIKMNIRGFTADEYVMYDLKHNDMKEYITEYERWIAEDINGKYAPFMSEKLLLSGIFDDIKTPKTYGYIEGGICYGCSGKLEESEVLSLIEKQEKVIAKPVNSPGGGFGVYVISTDGNSGFYIDDKPISKKDLIEKITTSEGYMLSQVVKQHHYAMQIYPRTTNTIRIISIWRKNEDKPKIVLAAQRIGREKSFPVDNACAGGLFGWIDVDSGTVESVKEYGSENCYTIHPDTGTQLVGIKIPGWEAIKESLLKSHSKRRYFRFIAWDVIVTEDGFYICEVNRGCDLWLFQVFRGLRNSELGDLYKEYGIIK